MSAPDDVATLAREFLCNETVQHFALGQIDPHFGVTATASDRVETVPLRDLAPDRTRRPEP